MSGGGFAKHVGDGGNSCGCIHAEHSSQIARGMYLSHVLSIMESGFLRSRRFMPPVEAADVLCSLDNEDSCMDTYQQVKTSIEQGLQELLREREIDPERELGPRILGQAGRFLPAFDLLQGVGSQQ